MEGRYSYWWMTITSGLGIFCGISIFFIFTFHFHNDYAGAFGLISGIFAAISLHLTLLNSSNRLITWYSPNNLKALSAFSVISCIFSLSLTLFFVIFASTHGMPLLPVEGSYYLAAVWSAMTVKWALTVSIMSFNYARVLQDTTPFLVVQEEED